MVLSPEVARLAASDNARVPLWRHGVAAERDRRYAIAACLEGQYVVLAVFCTAPFLGHLLRSRRHLLEMASPPERRRSGREVYSMICEWEGDDARAAYAAGQPNASKGELDRVARRHRNGPGGKGPALRYERFGLYNLSRDPEVLSLRRAIDAIFGVPEADYMRALQQPTFSAFMREVQASGKIPNVFGGLGAAKSSSELSYLERVPVDEVVAGGPNYRAEIAVCLQQAGLLAAGACPHRSVLDRVGAAILDVWEAGAAAAIDDACRSIPLARRFERVLRILLERRHQHKEMDGIACECHRYRVGFWAHDGVRDRSGCVYRPRNYRRPSLAQREPPADAEWWVGVPEVSWCADVLGGQWVSQLRWYTLDELAPDGGA